MPEPMVTPTAFSRAAGVAQSSIVQAIKEGRLQAYSKSGRRVSSDFKGPKRLKFDEALKSFDENRTRLNDSFLTKDDEKGGPPRGHDLVTARTRTSNLQAALLQMRLSRELGNVIPRAASFAVMETLGRAIRRAHAGGAGWAEELGAAFQNGGVGALSALLRAKFDELGNSIADLIVAAEAEYSGEQESGTDVAG